MANGIKLGARLVVAFGGRSRQTLDLPNSGEYRLLEKPALTEPWCEPHGHLIVVGLFVQGFLTIDATQMRDAL